MSTVDVAASELGPPDSEEQEGVWQRAIANLKSGNLGVLPVVLGEVLIVAFFSFTATNFFTASNFVNVILQMAGVTMIAFGVVFVLLIAEIDLSIGFLSGIAALTAAELQLPDGHNWPGLGVHPRRARRRRDHRSGTGHVRREGGGSVVRRHAGRASHLAGRDPEGAPGERRDHRRGRLDQQDGDVLLLRDG